MSPKRAAVVPSHLGYYTEHGISPVKYDVSDLGAHFDRREALYRGLGLPPMAFKGCEVLEVAPGSGQNGLYVASMMPRRYDLVEPNPAAIADITALYDGFALPHVAPRVHALRFEDFSAPRSYDLVICENWLSALPHERPLIAKLAGMVLPGGVLVLTFTPLTGFFPNIVRKLFALRLMPPDAPFLEQTEYLTEIFAPHLSTIRSMTRSHQHWVQDCMLNPHYLTVALSLDVVLEEIGAGCELLSSVPHFVSDWRWFKSVVGEGRQFNDNFRRGYCENLHNFVDYKSSFAPRQAAQNAALDAACTSLHAAAQNWQAAHAAGTSDHATFDRITELLGMLGEELGRIDLGWRRAVVEARDAWAEQVFDPARIKDMQYFSELFGRETVYLSSTRTRRSVATAP